MSRDEKVLYIKGLILDDVTEDIIKQSEVVVGWGVQNDTVEDYIRDAKELIVEDEKKRLENIEKAKKATENSSDIVALTALKDFNDGNGGIIKKDEDFDSPKVFVNDFVRHGYAKLKTQE